MKLISTFLTLGAALAVPTGDAPQRRRLLSWGTTFCYPDSESLTIPDPTCSGGLPQNAEPCSATATEPGALCELSDGVGSRGTDANRWGAGYIFKYCPTRIVFELADGSQRAFCADLQPVPPPNDWSTTLRPSDRPYEAHGNSWWPWARCAADWSRSWVGGKCIDDTRYLGETCGDGLECNNSGVASYDGLHLSCAPASATNLAISSPTCVPSAFLLDVEKDQCECNDWWRFDWNFFVACGAKDGFCNGHSCVLSTGDGNKYCDYQTDNNW